MNIKVIRKLYKIPIEYSIKIFDDHFKKWITVYATYSSNKTIIENDIILSHNNYWNEDKLEEFLEMFESPIASLILFIEMLKKYDININSLGWDYNYKKTSFGKYNDAEIFITNFTSEDIKNYNFVEYGILKVEKIDQKYIIDIFNSFNDSLIKTEILDGKVNIIESGNIYFNIEPQIIKNFSLYTVNNTKNILEKSVFIKPDIIVDVENFIKTSPKKDFIKELSANPDRYINASQKKNFIKAKTHFQLKNKQYNYILSLENNPENKKGFTISAINSLLTMCPFSDINKEFIVTKQDLHKISPTVKSKLLNSINNIHKNKSSRKKETPGLSNITNINRELHTKLHTIASEMGLINTQLEKNYFSSMSLGNQKKMLSKWVRTVLK